MSTDDRLHLELVQELNAIRSHVIAAECLMRRMHALRHPELKPLRYREFFTDLEPTPVLDAETRAAIDETP